MSKIPNYLIHYNINPGKFDMINESSKQHQMSIKLNQLLYLSTDNCSPLVEITESAWRQKKTKDSKTA